MSRGKPECVLGWLSKAINKMPHLVQFVIAHPIQLILIPSPDTTSNRSKIHLRLTVFDLFDIQIKEIHLKTKENEGAISFRSPFCLYDNLTQNFYDHNKEEGWKGFPRLRLQQLLKEPIKEQLIRIKDSMEMHTRIQLHHLWLKLFIFKN